MSQMFRIANAAAVLSAALPLTESKSVGIVSDAGADDDFICFVAINASQGDLFSVTVAGSDGFERFDSFDEALPSILTALTQVCNGEIEYYLA